MSDSVATKKFSQLRVEYIAHFAKVYGLDVADKADLIMTCYDKGEITEDSMEHQLVALTVEYKTRRWLWYTQCALEGAMCGILIGLAINKLRS